MLKMVVKEQDGFGNNNICCSVKADNFGKQQNINA